MTIFGQPYPENEPINNPTRKPNTKPAPDHTITPLMKQKL